MLEHVYNEKYTIKYALGHNEYYVDFEIWDNYDVSDNIEYDARGSVKWDGCMNWETNPSCMMHFCEIEEAKEFGLILAKVWELAKTVMPKADF